MRNAKNVHSVRICLTHLVTKVDLGYFGGNLLQRTFSQFIFKCEGPSLFTLVKKKSECVESLISHLNLCLTMGVYFWTADTT